MIVEGADGEFTPSRPAALFEKLAAGDMHDERNLDRFLGDRRTSSARRTT